jgi:hypothetical protein
MLKTSKRAIVAQTIQSNAVERRARMNVSAPENSIGASLALQFWSILAPSQGTVYPPSGANGYSSLNRASDSEDSDKENIVNSQQVNPLVTIPAEEELLVTIPAEEEELLVTIPAAEEELLVTIPAAEEELLVTIPAAEEELLVTIPAAEEELLVTIPAEEELLVTISAKKEPPATPPRSKIPAVKEPPATPSRHNPPVMKR